MCLLVCVVVLCLSPSFCECFFSLWDRCEFRSSFSLFCCCSFSVSALLSVCVLSVVVAAVFVRVSRSLPLRRCLRPDVRVVALPFCLCCGAVSPFSLSFFLSLSRALSLSPHLPLNRWASSVALGLCACDFVSQNALARENAPPPTQA